jgi:uncharacterized membrane protein
MSQIQESVDVEVPVRTAYDQWTQFEDFPHFMGGVEEVRQLDDTRLHWVAEIAGVHREWDAEITEQIPDERVAWTNINGLTNGGVVTFQRLAPDRTRVMLQLDFEPEGFVENVGDKLGFVAGQTKADLERFREFITARGSATGAWRGEVRGGDVRGGEMRTDAGITDAGISDMDITAVDDPYEDAYEDPSDPRSM